MERWRSFFSQAGADVWTIIEQAILLAATDYPREFKEKRCDIAETLFARRPIHGDTEATRLSASVITNCTNRMEADEPRDNEHGSEHAMKPVRHDAEQRHTDFCSAEPLNDDSDDHASIRTVVHDIKETLNDSLQSDAAVLDALQTLESLHISVDVLKATEIGKQVNNMRKHSCKEVRLLAKGLVRHWKELVDDWVNSAGNAITDPLESGRRATSERVNEEQGLSSIPLDENILLSARMPLEMPQLCYYGTKSRHLELPEERGSSSRAELSGLDRAETLERKPQLNGRGGVSSEISKDERGIDHVGRLSGTKSSYGGSGPGRPLMDASYGKGNGLTGNRGIGNLSNEISNVSNNYYTQGDNSSQKNRNSKLPTLNQRSTCVDGAHLEDKLEVAKRKLHEGYTQAENVKKQRTAQLLDLSDLPNGGLARAKAAAPKLAAQSGHWNQSRK